MKAFVAVLSFLLAGVALADQPPQQYKPEPAYPDQPAKYAFDWQVKDDYSKNDYGQEEQRDGASTKGSYYVALPDGRLQKVTYSVDGYGGFVADVTYEGEAQYEEAASYQQNTYKPAPPRYPARPAPAPEPKYEPAPAPAPAPEPKYEQPAAAPAPEYPAPAAPAPQYPAPAAPAPQYPAPAAPAPQYPAPAAPAPAPQYAPAEEPATEAPSSYEPAATASPVYYKPLESAPAPEVYYKPVEKSDKLEPKVYYRVAQRI